LIARRLPRSELKAAVCLVGGAWIVYCGAATALKRSIAQHNLWENYRQVVAQVIRVAPRLERETVLILMNVPKRTDPFGDNMWFDVAARLAYPFTSVKGFYFLDDGSPAPGNNVHVKGDDWEFDDSLFMTRGQKFQIRNTLVVSYDPSGNSTILDRLPDQLKPDAIAARLYQPYARIRSGPPTARARHRFLKGNGKTNQDG
jgi:hypothetical protein